MWHFKFDTTYTATKYSYILPAAKHQIRQNTSSVILSLTACSATDHHGIEIRMGRTDIDIVVVEPDSSWATRYTRKNIYYFLHHLIQKQYKNKEDFYILSNLPLSDLIWFNWVQWFNNCLNSIGDSWNHNCWNHSGFLFINKYSLNLEKLLR